MISERNCKPDFIPDNHIRLRTCRKEFAVEIFWHKPAKFESLCPHTDFIHNDSQSCTKFMPDSERYFHLHLISDSTGETLIAASRAVTSQYEKTHAIEHVYPAVRSKAKLLEAFENIDAKPGIVLFTIANEALAAHLVERCEAIGIPCVSVLDPIFKIFQSYLGIPENRKTGAQHELNAEYFNRIDAINFTLMHDDGALPDNINEADIVLLGISRTSKTPTSIYLANRGFKTTNFPLVPNTAIPEKLLKAKMHM